MLPLSIIFFVIGLIFVIRWFSDHKFEYMDGVKPSEQLDANFWAGTIFTLAAGTLMLLWHIKTN